MFFTNAVVSLLVAGAAAFPSHHMKRNTTTQIGAVYFCTGTNYTGTCEYQTNPINTCVQLQGAFNGTLSSFGPDSGAECLLMQGKCNAEEDYYSITYPGYANLSTIGFNDRANSYLCLEEFATTATKARVMKEAVAV